MSWDAAGRYYYRSRRVDGQPRREYVGTGPMAELSALEDEQAREDRIVRRAAERVERDRISLLDDQVAGLCRMVEDLVQGELQAAGYHQHDRGRWHRRRVVD